MNNTTVFVILLYYVILFALMITYVALYNTSIEDQYDPIGFDVDTKSYDMNRASTYFKRYVRLFKRRYLNLIDYNDAFAVFKKNLEVINKLNKQYDDAEFRVNEFTDLSLWNFTMNYTGFKMTSAGRVRVLYPTGWPDSWTPDTWDMRDEGKVRTSVPHQKNCSISYIYAAVGVLEGQPAFSYALQRQVSQESFELAEEHVFDCTDKFTCKSNGTPAEVFDAIKEIGGLHAKSNYNNTVPRQQNHYPLEKAKCMDNYRPFMVTPTECTNWILSEEWHSRLLSQYGVWASSIFVSEAIKNYHSGILDPTDCDHESNHNILIVGAGVNKKTKRRHWIIRNSWGDMWGEKGYLRLVRDKGFPCRVVKEYVGKCYINYTRLYPTVSVWPKPKQIRKSTTPLLREKITDPVYSEGDTDTSETSSSSNSEQEPNIQL